MHIIITFAAYLIFMLLVGTHFYKKNESLSDYLIGDRQLNKWVTSMSAQASDMSGWLLLGLPGYAYLQGMAAFDGDQLRVEAGSRTRTSYVRFDTAGITAADGVRLRLTVGSDPGDGTLQIALGEGGIWTEPSSAAATRPVEMPMPRPNGSSPSPAQEVLIVPCAACISTAAAVARSA